MEVYFSVLKQMFILLFMLFIYLGGIEGGRKLNDLINMSQFLLFFFWQEKMNAAACQISCQEAEHLNNKLEKLESLLFLLFIHTLFFEGKNNLGWEKVDAINDWLIDA